MSRKMHAWAGVPTLLLLMALALSGAILALEPVWERATTMVPSAASVTVADVAMMASREQDAVERITRSPNGRVLVYASDGENRRILRLDLTTGGMQPHVEDHSWQTVRAFHRSLLLGDGGRMLTGAGAVCMLLLSLSGLVLFVKQQGGWRALLRPVRAGTGGRRHATLARVALPLLLLTAMTGGYLSLASFELVPDATGATELEPSPGYKDLRPRPVAFTEIPDLTGMDINDLRELGFPREGEPKVLRLVSSKGVRLLDEASGAKIAFAELGLGSRLYEWVYALHTGQGLWALAVPLGFGALAVPYLGMTGLLLWWRRRSLVPRFNGKVSSRCADTILLVGSDGGSTWQFAATLFRALTAAGLRVHVAPMNALRRAYPNAERVIIMTSTYGAGDAPATAKNFLSCLGRFTGAPAFVVLGFGERSFANFCGYAERVDRALAAAGWKRLAPLSRIDRQSAQAFSLFGRLLSRLVGQTIILEHVPALPKTTELQLIERTDYGEEVQAPTAVLRFVPVASNRLRGAFFRRCSPAQFVAGDLLGVLSTGSRVPRFYSLASSAEDGVFEICVRKQPGGECSSFLHAMRPGDRIQAFIKPNPTFRPVVGKQPLVLIGAGAGLGPLVGIIRSNVKQRPIHLYWGGRHPASDFLYEGDLSYYLTDRRLTRLRTAFSRTEARTYVQDRIAIEANVIRDLLQRDAQFLVCGGRDMAKGVADTIDRIVRPIGWTLDRLKETGRYVEDTY